MKSLMLLVIAPFLVGAANPMVLPPIGGWQLDYADNSCRLGRRFGDARNPSLLLLQQAGPDDSMSMVVISGKLGEMRGARDVKARFMPWSTEFDGGMAATSTTAKQPAVMWGHVGFVPPDYPDLEKLRPAERMRLLAAIDAQRAMPVDLVERDRKRAESITRAKATTSIEIETRRNKAVVLDTGTMGKPIAMLAECTRDLVKSWGLDPDVQDKIVRPARKAAAPESWFRSEDYPRNGLIRGEESVVMARVLLNAEGKPTDCASLSHFDAPDFQTAVCKIILARGRFDPAELADGTKVPSYYTVNVRFVIPR